MGTATEELADRAGPGIGGLLNVTFGNLPELLIAFFALRAGLHEVVKASIIGSVLGNVLLVLGGSMLVGGLRRERQSFNHKAASSQATMLILALGRADHAGGLRARQGRRPAAAGRRARHVRRRRRGAVVDGGDRAPRSRYAAGLWFSLVSHRDLFNPPDERGDSSDEPWTVKSAVIVLAVAGLAVGLMSEILVGSIARDRRVRSA